MLRKPQKRTTQKKVRHNQMSDEATEFATVLLGHAKGRAHDEATAKLREAVEASLRTGKPASVTVKLAISSIDGEVIKIADKVTATIPEEPRKSMWYGDSEGGLHRTNPRQHEFDYVGPADNKTAAAGKDS